jgi:hypothetical protein
MKFKILLGRVPERYCGCRGLYVLSPRFALVRYRIDAILQKATGIAGTLARIL